jgi:ubiquinone/menaquinone biosynthesis C-methylase UbiE
MSSNDADHKARMRTVFDRLVDDYDVHGPGCFAWFGQRLVDLAGVEPGMRILDVACGRGAILIPAAERVGASGTVTGIDLSGAMVQAANDAARQRSYGDIAQVGDAEQLPFPDASFDRVLCGFGLMFFPNVDRALTEFRRVLAPAGRIGVSTWQASQADDLGTVLAELGFSGSGEPGWITDPGDLTHLLEQASYTDVRVTAETHAFRYADVDQYWQNARGTGLRRWLDALDASQTELVRAAFAERVAPHRQPDGIYLDATALLATARC